MKPCCEPLLTAFTKWRGRKGAPSTIVTCPEDNQQLRHREHPLPLADLDGSGVARPVPNKRRSGRDDHRVSILKRPASAPAQPAKRVRVEPSLPADSGGAAGSGGVPADSGGAAGSGGGNSAAFTPPVAQDRCKARTWNNGKGGQCSSFPMPEGRYCKRHRGALAHGDVEGEIPPEKLRQFMRARQ